MGAPIAFGPGLDGLPVPLPQAETSQPATVDAQCLICLAGSCAHYQGVVQAVDVEDRATRRTTRACHRLCARGSHLGLAEADIYACSEYRPRRVVEAAAWSAVQRNAELLDGLDENRPDECQSICDAGPCEELCVALYRGPNDHEQQVGRWCRLLSTVEKLFSLSEAPVLSCTAWRPRVLDPAAAARGVEAAEIAVEQARRHATAEDPNA